MCDHLTQYKWKAAKSPLQELLRKKAALHKGKGEVASLPKQARETHPPSHDQCFSFSAVCCSLYSPRGGHLGTQEEVFNLKQLKPSVLYPNKAMQSIDSESIPYFHKINSTDLTFLSDTESGRTGAMCLGKNFALTHLNENCYSHRKCAVPLQNSPSRFVLLAFLFIQTYGSKRIRN